jgi:hypothetical protein
MKKYILCLTFLMLFIFGTQGVFAQFRATLSGSLNIDPVYIFSPTGDVADPNATNLKNNALYWNGNTVESVGRYLGGTKYEFFTHPSYIGRNQLFLSLSHNVRNISGNMRLNASRLVQYNDWTSVRYDYQNPEDAEYYLGSPRKGSLFRPNTPYEYNSGLTTASLLYFLDSFIDRWDITADFGRIKFFYGTYDLTYQNSGVVRSLVWDYKTDVLKSNIDPFHIGIPVYAPFIAYHGGFEMDFINTRHPGKVMSIRSNMDPFYFYRYKYIEHANVNYSPYNTENNPFLSGELDAAYALFTYGPFLNNFHVAIGANLLGEMSNYMRRAQTNSTLEAAGYLRLTGRRVLNNKVSFDAVYRVRGIDGSLSDFDPTGTYENIAEGRDQWLNGVSPNRFYKNKGKDGFGEFAHNFGLFFDLFLIHRLDLAIGLHGYVKTLKDIEEGAIDYSSPVGSTSNITAIRDVKRVSPFLFSIDIKAAYPLRRELAICTSNTITFSTIGGTNDEGEWRYSILGARPFNPTNYGSDPNFARNSLNHVILKEGERDTWLYFYNFLALRYEFSESLRGYLGFANRLGFLNEVRVDPSTDTQFTVNRISNFLSAEATLRYRVGSGTMFAGLAYRLELGSVKSDWDNPNAKDYFIGQQAFCIPFRFEWSF